MGWLCGPGQRPLRGDCDRAEALHMVDEAVQQPALVSQLEAEGATDPQVVGSGVREVGHDAPPGQGSANVRSASMSTLA